MNGIQNICFQKAISVNGVRQEFKERDSYQLREWHNPLSNPPVQIWSYEDLEPEPEERVYHCAICKTKLDYIKNIEMWNCSECMQYYDTKIQDVPIKNINEFRVTPWSELQHYPTVDMDDPELPFAEGIDHNVMLEEGLENKTHPEDKRVQHINLHNVIFADAILKGALTARKKEDDNDGVT